MKSVLIINGPNLNMLGIREPDLYGKQDYSTLVSMISGHCKELGLECECFQHNHEGAIVDKIQEAYGRYDAIVINAAAYTHTSVAIMDAIKTVSIPAVEVHITEPNEREEFRHISYVGKACVHRIAGHGFKGYLEAIDWLAANY
ncbi:MAG: type II 3-dehydroquinate dehydratase [Firmicutes bacterium]|nr:type II 3-dehydroquinate dehydratase [Bacillota bacterium]